ncbi:MAG: MMPL family transporter [Deltaproteobacteria bacterium]|nr:MMPL family transporter [Deltaproteobacteria bacterium]
MNTKSAWLKWGIAFFLTTFGLFAASGIYLGEDALDLLPDSAVRGDIQLLQRMGLVNRVFINLEIDPSQTAFSKNGVEQALQTSARQVGSALAENPVFREVLYQLPPGHEWKLLDQLWAYLPALLTEGDLRRLQSKLTTDGLNQALTEDFALLNSPAGLPLKEQIRRDPLGLSRLLIKRLSSLRGDFTAQIRDGFFFSQDGRNCLIWAESALPLTDSKAAEQVQDEVQKALEQGLVHGVNARIIGALPHTLANARTVQRDLRKLLPLATLTLFIFFFLIFRDPRALLVVGIPFMAAPVAIAVLRLFYDRVSAIALGFGIVLLGIAVDSAIHIYLALSRNPGGKDAVLKGIKRPVILSTATTLAVFVVLLFSEVPSHRQMAALAITGVFLAVVLAWMLVPTLAIRKPLISKKEHIKPGLRYSKSKLILWGLLLAAGALAWPRLQYNGNLQTLDMVTPKIEADEAHFRATWGPSGDETFILAAGSTLPQALDRNDQVYEELQRHSISGLRSISPILPGPCLQTQNISNWNVFWEKQRIRVEKEIDQIGTELGFISGAFSPFFEWLSAEPVILDPSVLLSGPLSPLIYSMLRLPDKHGTKKSDNNGHEILITTIVPDTPATWPVLKKLQEQIPKVAVLSNSKWRSNIETLVRHDVTRLSIAAGIIIICLIWFFFRMPMPVLGTLAPVLSALSSMAIFNYLCNKDINLMHILIGIMVIGISVDYGIFVVCACQRAISKTTFFAVSMCAVSTLSGFGVLSLAEHPALHTLGTTVLVGIGAAWPTALWITPTILKGGRGKVDRLKVEG